MNRVLVTGATGFVGRALCEGLAGCGYRVRAAVRANVALPASVAETAVVGNIDANTEWREALEGVDFVVHLAARVHGRAERVFDRQLYPQTNAWGTQRLAAAAAAAGVRRLLFLSTVKVNGDSTGAEPYTARDLPRPQDPYGCSKLLGEELLREATKHSSLEVAIVRPPLVYGPGVKANFLRLLQWVHRGWPMPLGAVNNRRSMVNVWNLCDLLLRLLTHPAAPGQVWMVSDGDDRSTPQLIREIGVAMRRPVRLIPVPLPLLQGLAALTGRAADVGRLCSSLQVDISQTRRALSWSPPLAFPEGVARTVDWYLSVNR